MKKTFEISVIIIHNNEYSNKPLERWVKIFKLEKIRPPTPLGSSLVLLSFIIIIHLLSCYLSFVILHLYLICSGFCHPLKIIFYDSISLQKNYSTAPQLWQKLHQSGNNSSSYSCKQWTTLLHLLTVCQACQTLNK